MGKSQPKIIKPSKLIVLLGPTATGKTKLAVKLAHKYDGEIISADSRQVYSGMDIGTGKDLAEYSIRDDRGKIIAGVKYHLIDILSPQTDFNVAKYQKLAYLAIEDIRQRGKQPFLVGGTGLYIDAVINGYVFDGAESHRTKAENQALRNRLSKLSLPQLLSRLKKIDPRTFAIIDQKNRRRVQRALEIYFSLGRPKSDCPASVKPPYQILLLGLKFPLPEIYRRIDSRLETRIKEGMIAEIKKLRRAGVSWKRLDEFGLEYRYVSRYLRGLLDYDQMVTQLKNAIHHFAKRQLTWFKRNREIIWIKNYSEAQRQINKFLR